MNHNGLFISFEGLEASGKSEQIRLLTGKLQKEKYQIVTTREPGGTPFGERMRHELIYGENLSAEQEALLLAASRSALVDQVILPALNNHHIVITDRFVDSSIAYQGYGRGMGCSYVTAINEKVIKGLLPDITFFIDATPRQSFELLKNVRAGRLDRIEKEEISFFNRVYEGYCALALADKKRFRVIPYIPGGQDSMQAQIAGHVQEYIQKQGLEATLARKQT